MISQLNWSFDNADTSGQVKLPRISFKSVVNRFNKIEEENNVYRFDERVMNKKTNAPNEPVAFEQTAKVSDERNKTRPLLPDILKLEQSDFDPWSKHFADELTFSIDTSLWMMGMELQFSFDKEIFNYSGFENLFLQNLPGLTFKRSSDKQGNVVFYTFILDKLRKTKMWEGSLLRLTIDVKDECTYPVDYKWKIYNYKSDVISQGRKKLEIRTYKKIPNQYALFQNFPNPFNPSTKIRYQLPINGKVKLEVFNILGQRVRTIKDGYQEAGYYEILWDHRLYNSSLASGLYIYRLIVRGDDGKRFVKSKKMLLVK